MRRLPRTSQLSPTSPTVGSSLASVSTSRAPGSGRRTMSSTGPSPVGARRIGSSPASSCWRVRWITGPSLAERRPPERATSLRQASPKGCAVDPVDRRERRDLLPLQACVGWCTGWPSATTRGDGQLVGDAEQRPHLLLAPDHHRGDDPAEALVTGGQQDAPHERVDGGAAGERVAIQVAVDRSERAEVGQHGEQDRHLVEVLGEAARARGGVGRDVGGPTVDGLPLGLAVGHGREGHHAGRADREVVVPDGLVELPETGADGRVAHDHDPPRLAVATARREASGVEDAGGGSRPAPVRR